jgi:hypothetical protein
MNCETARFTGDADATGVGTTGDLPPYRARLPAGPKMLGPWRYTGRTWPVLAGRQGSLPTYDP